MLRYLVLLLLFSFPQICFSQQVAKELITTEGKKRAYYLFVPEKLSASQPLPLIVLLHGSGRNGLSLVDKWKDLAKKEKVILVGPDALDSGSWRIPEDSLSFVDSAGYSRRF